MFFGDAHAGSDVVDSGCARFGLHGRCWATAGRFTLLSTTSDAHRHLQHQWLERRQPVLLRWLEQTRPDVACLQELKSPQERFPQEELRSLCYEAIWQGQKSWNGVAILARAGMPIETRRGLPPGDPDDTHSRYLETEIGGLTVACLYLPNGNHHYHRADHHCYDVAHDPPDGLCPAGRVDAWRMRC